LTCRNLNTIHQNGLLFTVTRREGRQKWDEKKKESEKKYANIKIIWQIDNEAYNALVPEYNEKLETLNYYQEKYQKYESEIDDYNSKI